MFEKQVYIKRKQKTSGKIVWIIKSSVLLFILLITINIFANLFVFPSVAKGSILVSPLANEIIHKTVSFINSQGNNSQIDQIVNEVLEDKKQNFGIVIKNLTNGERYYLNEDDIFDSASLYKLWVMAVTLEQEQNGLLHDNDLLTNIDPNLNIQLNSSDAANLNNINISTSVKSALEKMITFSDNYSAKLLTNKVQLANISTFLLLNNFNDSKVGTDTDNPKTSARDIASFFDKLYHDKLNNADISNRMLDLLKRQQLNGKIPKYINDNVEIAHKTGELNAFSHDAGIIYGNKSKFIIVILTQSDNTPDANEKISEISKKVYDYFEK